MKKMIFSKRIEMLSIGPLVDDDTLKSRIQDCIRYQDFITTIAPNLHQVETAVQQLKDTDINVCAEIAFPLGNLPLEVKRIQIESAIKSGAARVEIMMPIEYLKIEDFKMAEKETAFLCSIPADQGVAVTLIANLCMLDRNQKLYAAEIAIKNKASFRTASGFGVETNLPDIKLIRDEFAEDIHLAACGNIQLAQSALDYIGMGADVICTSEPVNLIHGLEILKQHGYQEA